MKARNLLSRRGGAVLLSLALCAGLAAPGFAAVQLDKDTHIDAETGALLSHEEDGKESYDYYLGGDVTLDKTLVIGAGVAASIELNGHTLELNDIHEASVRSDGTLDSLTVRDTSKLDAPSSQGETGKKKWGSVIKVVGEGADLTVTDSTALDEETGEYVAGQGTGAISGGYEGNSINEKKAIGGGGGVRVSDGGSFTMKGGSITENDVGMTHGGGIYVQNGTVELDNVTVSKNTAPNHGGGIYAKDSTVTMTGVDISQNKSKNKGSGGGIYATNSTVTLTDSTVDHNRCNTASTNNCYGGGIYANNGSKVTLNDSEVSYNRAYTNGGGIYITGADTTVEINGGAVAKNNANAGKSAIGDIAAPYSGTYTLNEVTMCSNTGTGGNNHERTHIGGGWDEGVVTKPATCAEEGVMTYTCKFCKTETKTEPIEKLAHTPADPVRENEVPATCAAEGSYDEVVKCAVCQEELSRTPKTIDKLEEHSWNAGEVTKPATCTAKGETTYTCTVCNETRVEEDVDMAAHTPGEAVRENVVNATYNAPGAYEEVVYCSVCNEELSRVEHELSQLVRPVPPADPTVEIDEPDVPLAGLPPYLTPAEGEDKLTRAQTIAILHWMDSEPEAELATFLDVLADSGYAEAIGWAQENGIALGVGGNRFAPDEYVTRGQLVEFLNRYARYVGSDVVVELDGDPDEVLSWAQAEEIINDFFARLGETA